MERIRRDFVANASHELRTPLTSIRGFVEALEDGALEEPDHGPALPGQDPHACRPDDGARRRPARAEPARAGRPSPRVDCRSGLRTWPSEVVASFEDLAARKGIALVGAGRRRPRRRQRPRAAPAHPREPRRQRDQVHARGRPRRGQRPTAAPDGAARIEVKDDGPGIAAGAPRPHLRALLPGRQGAQPRAGRHRASASRSSSTSPRAWARRSRSRAQPGQGSRFAVLVAGEAGAGVRQRTPGLGVAAFDVLGGPGVAAG